MPNREPSSSRPIALVKSPLPSASIRMSVPTPWFSPQAFITNTSLTETQAMVSTPLALKSATCCLKLGRCLAEQVGVKAPGTANSATFLPANSASVVSGPGPSAPKGVNVAAGTLSPTLIVMSSLLRAFAAHRTGRAPSQAIADQLRLESAATRPDHRFMSDSEEPFLTGRMLVAMPGIGDPRFQRALIFLCAHNAEHAMGLAVNRPVEGLSVGSVLKRLKVGGAASSITLTDDLGVKGGPG